jgi:putative glutamine amidotransferase
MRPIIGITGRPNLQASAGGDLHAYLVHHTYSDSVISAGGLPVVLVPVDEEHVDDVLDRLDGVLIPGGGDIDPLRYSDSRHETARGINEERDQHEVAVALGAKARRMPVFAICRGLQIVNVALGGTLIQDLPSHTGANGHDIVGDAAYEPHSHALVEPQCRIASVLGAGLQEINSIHHQAVEELGDGLRVVASAPDGTIEAIEHDDSEWPLLAVQWHPEFLGMRDHGPSHALFEAFVESAAKYRADR